MEWSLFTCVPCVETLHLDALTSAKRGPAAFASSQMNAQQGVAVDNRKRFDL